MNITEYISISLSPLQPKESIENAKKLFKNNGFTHFPVVENNKLMGSVFKEDLEIIENKTAILATQAYLFDLFFTDDKATVLELLKIFTDNDTNVIPVLNDEKNYVGYYELKEVLQVFCSSPFMTEEGHILTLKKATVDFSMSKITQIVEANDGKLLGTYVYEKDEIFTEVMLKISTNDTNNMLQTFRRFEYEVTSRHENDIYLEDLKNRSEYLQKYLEI